MGITLKYNVDGEDFTRAGEASGEIKKTLKKLGFPPETVRNVAIAVYEGEINMVIHADGGEITADLSEDEITVTLADKGPGIPDIDMAMKEGYSTAPENVRALGFGAGMGLPNIKKYSDGMDIESVVGQGTTIKLKFIPK
ncbi:MAG: ATP-binding protein [Clostridiales bacterium]|nr:ATP-binding protein [Clostridiales bacterium]